MCRIVKTCAEFFCQAKRCWLRNSTFVKVRVLFVFSAKEAGNPENALWGQFSTASREVANMGQGPDRVSVRGMENGLETLGSASQQKADGQIRGSRPITDLLPTSHCRLGLRG